MHLLHPLGSSTCRTWHRRKTQLGPGTGRWRRRLLGPGPIREKILETCWDNLLAHCWPTPYVLLPNLKSEVEQLVRVGSTQLVEVEHGSVVI